MPQDPSVAPADPDYFQSLLFARLDEIIGLLDALTTILADQDDEDAYFLPDPVMLLALDDDEVPY